MHHHGLVSTAASAELMRLRIARLARVLGRTGLIGNGPFQERACAQPLASAGSIRVRHFGHLSGQIPLLQQTTEVESRGLTRNRIEAAESGE